MPEPRRAPQTHSAQPPARAAAKPRKPRQSLETIDEMIADLKKQIERLSALIDKKMGETEGTQDLARLFSVYAQAASNLGGLLRDRRALSGESADHLAGLVAQVVDEVGTELGWKV